MEHTSNEEVLVHLKYLREGVDGIKDRLDEQNGRIRTAETKVAILEDRQLEARKAGGICGGIVSGVIVAMHYILGGGK